MYGALARSRERFWADPERHRVGRHDLQWARRHIVRRVPGRRALVDLHVGSPFNGFANLEKVVAITPRAAPDLILLAGDYVIHGVVGERFQPPEGAATTGKAHMT